MKILECEYCKKPIREAIAYHKTFMYHPKCYIIKDRKTYPILFGGNWKIHAVKFTADKSKKRRADVLLTNKGSGMELLIHNWKRHPFFHYEIRHNNKIFLDGEIKALNVSDFVNEIIPLIEENIKRLENE